MWTATTIGSDGSRTDRPETFESRAEAQAWAEAEFGIEVWYREKPMDESDDPPMTGYRSQIDLVRDHRMVIIEHD